MEGWATARSVMLSALLPLLEWLRLPIPPKDGQGTITSW